MRAQPLLYAFVSGVLACGAPSERTPAPPSSADVGFSGQDGVVPLGGDVALPDAAPTEVPNDVTDAPDPSDVATDDLGSAPEVMVPDVAPPAPDTGPVVDPACAELQPGEAVARLLTRLEYDLAAGDLLLTTTSVARDTFPPENHALGFENNADAHLPSPALVEAQIEAARLLAEDTVTHRLAQIAPCAASGGC